jgi:hypothetical protein
MQRTPGSPGNFPIHPEWISATSRLDGISPPTFRQAVPIRRGQASMSAIRRTGRKIHSVVCAGGPQVISHSTMMMACFGRLSSIASATTLTGMRGRFDFVGVGEAARGAHLLVSEDQGACRSVPALQPFEEKTKCSVISQTNCNCVPGSHNSRVSISV